MIGKNNKYLRNTKSGVKVETYSIKKFKVGAASVIIGASIFFGAAGVANAAEVSGDKTENIVIEKVTSSTDEKTDANSTLNNNTDANKQVEKKVLDKKTLQTNIEKVEELLEKINKDKAAASTLETIKIDLENAKEILNSADAELTQAEVDALAKKLSEKIFVLSSMPKANTSEKVVKEGENTIANTGTRDSRNGQSMDEGTQFRADSHNPTGETLTVPYNHNITDDEVKAKVRNFGPGTLKVQSKPSTNTSGNVGNAVVIVTYPDKSTKEVPVSVTVINQNKDDYTPKYDGGSGKPGAKIEISLKEENGKDIPEGTTYTSLTPEEITVDAKGKVTVTVPSDKNPRDKVTGKVFVRYPDKSTEEVPVSVTVINQDKDDYTPQYNDGSGKPGATVDISVTEATGKIIPAGTTYTSLTPEVVIVDDQGKVTVTIPANKKPGEEITGKVLVRYPDESSEEAPVIVTVVDRDKGDYTPKYDDGTGKPGARVEIPLKEENKKDIPAGTIFTSLTPEEITVDDQGKVTVTIPSDKNTGDKVTGKVFVRYPDNSVEEVPVSVTVLNRDKDIYTPQYNDGSGKPGASVDISVTEANGKTIPEGTTYTSLTPGEITVDNQGKVTVAIPSDKNPGDIVTGRIFVLYPDKSAEEVPVSVTVVNRDKDIYTPKYDDGSGKPGTSVDIPVSEANGKIIPAGTTYTSLTPGEITVDDQGKVTVAIPENKNPGDKVTGRVFVRYPDKSAEEVTVTVTVANVAKSGDLPLPITLPKLIITKWLDEEGNELRPKDAKTPSELGESNEVYEHGTIPGYDFVKTDTDSDEGVVTHIFKKLPVVTKSTKIRTSVNGELPDPIDLPKLIITKWVDEEGNELRPKDAKTPSKLGEPNEAYEYGTIPGYEYVRTEINPDGDVVTHIFRKVALGRIDSNDGKQIEDNTKDTTMNKSTKRLANTGESEINTGLTGLGLAMFGSLLAVAKKRREDEK